MVVEVRTSEDNVELPQWVTSRLKQDNPDLTQAIVEMVIWVDRVKCWMYQADADMNKIVGQLTDGQAQELAAVAASEANDGAEAPKSAFSLKALIADMKVDPDGE